jgi:hypothetical protein
MADRWVWIGEYTFGTRRAVLEKHEDTGAVRALVSKEDRPGQVEKVTGRRQEYVSDSRGRSA